MKEMFLIFTWAVSSKPSTFSLSFLSATTKKTVSTKATFLISENVPSPMGAFLSAFKNKVDAEKIQSEKGGELYSWEKLLAHLKN